MTPRSRVQVPIPGQSRQHPIRKGCTYNEGWLDSEGCPNVGKCTGGAG
jgi:hypothetical protein